MNHEHQFFSIEIKEIHANFNKLTLMAMGHENALTKQHKNIETMIMGSIQQSFNFLHSLTNNFSLMKQIS